MNEVTARQLIDEQPTAPQWIPCERELPERGYSYLVTDFGIVDEASYGLDGRWYSLSGNKLKDVMAWMPLPEPWRGEEHEASRHLQGT